MRRLFVGVDTGGTFTDLVALDESTGEFIYHKLPSSNDDPARAILEGVEALLQHQGAPADTVALLAHGTTVATNAVLEGKLPRTGLVTTEGFRDVLALARQRRPHLYNLDVPKPVPPVARELCLEVSERVAADGTLVTPLQVEDVDRVAAALKVANVESIAICFLHAYARPDHESAAKARLQTLLPNVHVCTSAEILPEFREFERCATTTINAALMPVMDRYLQRLEEGTESLGIPVRPLVMQSNGGTVSTASVRRAPVSTFLSGPAGGILGAAAAAIGAGVPDVISLDMGGTSTDVCLMRDGQARVRHNIEMGGFPVKTATIDIHTIGAGGGTIAYVDAGGLLHVGPQSAGAYPGPAAYGRGGDRPTVTDANVLLGRLNPVSLLDGRMAVYPDRARTVMESIAETLGLSVEAAAAGILRIINANMVQAVRVVSIDAGEDPREFALLPFGGAGPLHAAEIAAELGMRRILVPGRPGVLSAIGLLYAEPRADFGLTLLLPVGADAVDGLNEGAKQLTARAKAWAKEQEASWESCQLTWSAELRYVGQNFELNVPVPAMPLSEPDVAALSSAFHERHQAAYGYQIPDRSEEIVTLRLVVTIPRPATLPKVSPLATGTLPLPGSERPVWFESTGFVATPVWRRSTLPAGVQITGPAIIEQMDATTVVPLRTTCRVLPSGDLLLEMAVEGSEAL